MMYNKRSLGTEKEALACVFLESKGFHIVEKNFRCRFGEIDIIAKKENMLVFVEVKYRKNAKQGHPEEAVDWRKQRVIRKVGEYYLCKSKLGIYQPCRFDVIAIEGEAIRHYEHAFL